MAEAALVLSVISAGAAIVEKRKITKEQKKQNEIKNRITARSRMRDVRRAIAESRIRRAQAQAAGFEFGVSGGSAVAGAEFGITGDVASSIAESQQQFTGEQVLSEGRNRISSLQQSASTFGSISNLASQFDEQAVASITNLVRG